MATGAAAFVPRDYLWIPAALTVDWLTLIVAGVLLGLLFR
jgi:hypothetical protein